MFQLINKENLLSLQFKLAMVGHIADAAHDLVVSPATFERDFDSHFKHLFQVQTNLSRRSYSKYEQSLVSSRARGRALMQASQNLSSGACDHEASKE